MSNYGIPYMGSKAKILPQLCAVFPVAGNFYDLFGGGFSVTHYLMEKQKYKFKNFHFNEIQSDVVDLIKKAIAGEFSYEKFRPKFIDRNEFFLKKDSDAYIRGVWSFGNNQKDYLFGEGVEQYKKSLHNAVVFDEFNTIAVGVLGFSVWPAQLNTIKKRRFFIRRKVAADSKGMSRGDLEQLERLEQLGRLGRLEQLGRLGRLEQLGRLQQPEQLEFYSSSYENIPIKENSVVYCDIPYKGTAEYSNKEKFDYDKFFAWTDRAKFPVFISEYTGDERVFLIKSVEKRQLLNNGENSKKTKLENIYANKFALDNYPSIKKMYEKNKKAI